ncbi:hypothetical protein FGF1_21770 [Flavobacteriaceae bacterium GF1]
MNFQVLPNWCKKLGLGLFVIASLLTGGDAFKDGVEGVPMGTNHFFKNLYGSRLDHFLSLLPIFGLLIYMLSKEKIEDDYIKFLRLNSYQLTVIILLVVAFIIYIFSPEIKFSLDITLSLFIVLFLVIFYFKKNQAL